MGKMTDGDVMVYIRNHALGISKMAKDHELEINIIIQPDGYINCRANSYEFASHKGYYERYDYLPRGDISRWRHGIEPQNISFSGAPYMKWGGRK